MLTIKKLVTIVKESAINNGLTLNIKQESESKGIISITNDQEKKVKILSCTLKCLHVIMKKVIKIELLGKICSDSHVILDKMHPPYDLKVQPNPIESCDDISFLKFSTPQET